MGFKLVAYGALKNNLIQSIHSLASHYKQDAKEIIDTYAQDKANAVVLAVKYNKIPETRRTQIGLLLTLIRCLDASSKTEDEKKMPLNALALYIRELIFVSYEPRESVLNYLASYVVTPEHSCLFLKLTYSLEISSDNEPSNKDLMDGYKALKKCMESLLYSDPADPSIGYLADIPFSEEKIEKFNIEDFLKKLIVRISVLEQQLIDAGKAASPKQTAQQPTGIRFFSDITPSSVPVIGPKAISVCSA